jgi:hypothetical protein
VAGGATVTAMYRLLAGLSEHRPSSIVVLVLVIARIPPEGLVDHAAHEDRVLPRLPAHGAKLERRLRTRDGTTEIHVIRFPSQDALEHYQTDPLDDNVWATHRQPPPPRCSGDRLARQDLCGLPTAPRAKMACAGWWSWCEGDLLSSGARDARG